MSKSPKKNNGHETAAKLITKKVPVILDTQTIGEAEKMLLKKIHQYDSIHYLYVLNKENILKGILSIKEILNQRKSASVTKAMHKKFITVHPHTHQERVAHLAMMNKITAMPVVDMDGTFLGVVPSDVILSTMYLETREDLLRMAGVHHERENEITDNVMKLPILMSLWHRLPWLVLGLMGGLLSAQIVSFFEYTLSRNLILAAFIPLIVYMGDAVGTQMEAFIIRDYALNPDLKFWAYLLRHFVVIIIIGLITSVLLYFSSFLIYGDWNVSETLGIALFIAILSSMMTGLVVPFVFTRFRFDPANASGPIATIIQDLLSISIYFIVASSILSMV